MADATSTFTVKGKADVDDAVRGLNKLGESAEDAGEKAKGMGDYFRATVAGILSAETAMKGLEIVLGAAQAAFDFARQATLEYMQSTTEGRAQVALFNAELGKLKTAIGASITDSEAFGDGFDAAVEVLRDLTEIMPDLIRTLDNYYLTAVKVEEITSGVTGAMDTLGGALYNLTPFAAVENAFTLVGTAANNVTGAVGETEREVRAIAEASTAAVAPVNELGEAWSILSGSMSAAQAVAGTVTDFFFGVAEEAPPATVATRSYAEAIDMAVVSAEKLKKAQEDAAQAMRDNIAAMNAQDESWAALLEGFNAVGQAELERVQTSIAAAVAAAVEAKGKIAAALQPGEGEGGGGFFDVKKLEKDYDAMGEATSAFEGTAAGLGDSLSSSFGAALGSTENFGKAFKAALGQALVSQGITEILTGISNMIPFGPMFNPVAGAARLAGGTTMLAIGKAMGGKGSAPGGGGGAGRSVGESSGMTPVAQPQRQGPTNLIDYSGVTIVTNDTDSMRTLMDRQARTAQAGAGSRV